MRLIDAETINLEEFLDEDIPKYAILSHTWEDQEVTFQDMHALVTAATLMKRKRGYAKIKFACQQARKHGLGYVWVDTCKYRSIVVATCSHAYCVSSTTRRLHRQEV